MGWIRYRLHDKKLPGSPDIVLAKFKTVILLTAVFGIGTKDAKYVLHHLLTSISGPRV
jgi:DNA mismatch endonuclease (patch repair protein)